MDPLATKNDKHKSDLDKLQRLPYLTIWIKALITIPIGPKLQMLRLALLSRYCYIARQSSCPQDLPHRSLELQICTNNLEWKWDRQRQIYIIPRNCFKIHQASNPINTTTRQLKPRFHTRSHSTGFDQGHAKPPKLKVVQISSLVHAIGGDFPLETNISVRSLATLDKSFLWSSRSSITYLLYVLPQ